MDTEPADSRHGGIALLALGSAEVQGVKAWIFVFSGEWASSIQSIAFTMWII